MMKIYQMYGTSWVRGSIERGQFPANFGGKTVSVTPDRPVTSEDGIRRGEVAEHIVIYELDGRYGYEVWRKRTRRLKHYERTSALVKDDTWYDLARCVCIDDADLEKDTIEQAMARAEEVAKC